MPKALALDVGSRLDDIENKLELALVLEFERSPLTCIYTDTIKSNDIYMYLLF